MFTINLNKIEELAGEVISEVPYVKILSAPKYNEAEGRWEALAQVNEMLCNIELNIRILQKDINK